MTKEQIFIKVRAILFEQLNPTGNPKDPLFDHIKMETKLDSIEADSLDKVEIALRYEEEFGFKLDDSFIELQTVEQHVETLEREISSREAATVTPDA